MRRNSWILPLLAAMAMMELSSSTGRAGDIPGLALSDWSRHNNMAWQSLNQGKYDCAEQQFRLAIEAIRPYSRDDQRLLARSYMDLARVLYHRGRYADAEPLAEWALIVRDLHPKKNPDAIFQNLYLLAVIHIAKSTTTRPSPC